MGGTQGGARHVIQSTVLLALNYFIGARVIRTTAVKLPANLYDTAVVNKA